MSLRSVKRRRQRLYSTLGIRGRIDAAVYTDRIFAGEVRFQRPLLRVVP